MALGPLVAPSGVRTPAWLPSLGSLASVGSGSRIQYSNGSQSTQISGGPGALFIGRKWAWEGDGVA